MVKKETYSNKAKPEWNSFDNIWEIRQKHPVSPEELERIIKGNAFPYKWDLEFATKIGDTYLIDTVDFFIHLIAKTKRIRLPVWKVVCPRLDNPAQGAIYYIIKGEKDNLMFRGTYGYWDTGPHESAKIEQFLETLKLPIEVRDGDYLLSLLNREG